MNPRSRLSRFVLMACFAAVGAVCAVVVYRAFVIQFQEGSMYPPYSSHRADPMGLRVFHQALARIPDLTVTRFEKSLTRLPLKPAALIIAGAIHSDDPRYVIEHIEAFVAEGGRLVITFDAGALAQDVEFETWMERHGERDSREEQAEDETAEDTKPGEHGEAEDGEDRFDLLVNIEERWGFGVDCRNMDDDSGRLASRAKGVNARLLPETAPWISPCFFTELGEEWTPAYELDGKPVLIERDFEEGSIVLASDSYFLSNEALRDERAPGLLAWLAGPHTRVIFDESHLGIQHRPGIMSLMRRYRLHLLLFGLAAVAGLYIWRSVTSLTPRHSETYQTERAAEQAGLEAEAALTSLLRRTIPRKWVVSACCEAWRRDCLEAGHCPEETRRAVAEAAQTPSEDPVQRYRTLAALLTRDSAGQRKGRKP